VRGRARPIVQSHGALRASRPQLSAIRQAATAWRYNSVSLFVREYVQEISLSRFFVLSQRLIQAGLGAGVAFGCVLLTLEACAVSPPAPGCLQTEVPSVDTTVYARDSVDYKPRPEQGFTAPSPDLIISQTHAPNVEADAIVETTGYVSEKSVMLRHIETGQSANVVIGILRNTRFCPAIRRGVPVRYRMRLRFYLVVRRSS